MKKNDELPWIDYTDEVLERIFVLHHEKNRNVLCLDLNKKFGKLLYEKLLAQTPQPESIFKDKGLVPLNTQDCNKLKEIIRTKRLKVIELKESKNVK